MPDPLWPLAGVNPNNPTLGGFGYLEWSNGVYHPGLDLNSLYGGWGAGCNVDEGAAVVATEDAVVRFRGFHTTVSGRGFGHHTWLEGSRSGRWLHYCHLTAQANLPVGTLAPRGAALGRCGRTAGWECAHLHFEVTFAPPPSWDFWPVGWSMAMVAALYQSPEAYLHALTLPDDPSPIPPIEEPDMPPPTDEPLLTDAEVAHKLQPAVWGPWFPGDAAVGFAIPTRWRQELRAGRDLGPPLGPELDVPDVPGATYQRFQGGTVVYRDGKTSLVG